MTGEDVSLDERELAEQAFKALDTAAESTDLRWPPVAARIRAARMKTGLSDAQVAKRVGITSGSYYDAEGRDDEAFTVLSVADIVRLATVLGLSPSELLFGRNAPEKPEVTFDEIANRLRDLLSASGLGVEEFGEKIGWGVGDVLSNPDALWDFNLAGFRDVARAVGADWVTALPNRDSQPPSQRSL